MDVYIYTALMVLVIASAVLWYRKKAAAVPEDDEIDEELLQILARADAQSQPRAKVSLTDAQQVALCSASLGATVYAEGRFDPSFEMIEIYSPRTIDSLVKKGFLEAGAAGGYVITQAGSDANRINSGC